MYFNITIQNLFNPKYKYKKYFSYYKAISKNKNLELETFYSNYNLFNFSVNFQPMGRDHAGFGLDVNVFGWEFSFRIYDSRHWDYPNWCWEK